MAVVRGNVQDGSWPDQFGAEPRVNREPAPHFVRSPLTTTLSGSSGPTRSTCYSSKEVPVYFLDPFVYLISGK